MLKYVSQINSSCSATPPKWSLKLDSECVLRWIWTIDLLIFNQSHLPLSYQDIKLEYFVLRSDTSLPTKHNESLTREHKEKGTKERYRTGWQLCCYPVGWWNQAWRCLKSSNFNDSTLIWGPKNLIGGLHPPIAALGCHWMPLDTFSNNWVLRAPDSSRRLPLDRWF